MSLSVPYVDIDIRYIYRSLKLKCCKIDCTLAYG